MEAKEFEVETILTILTDISFENGLDNAKLLIEHMTGEPASEFTFLEGSRPKICAAEILNQHPKLKSFMDKFNPPDEGQVGMPTVKRYLYAFMEEIWWNMGMKLELKPIENMPTPEEYFFGSPT